MKIVCWFVTAVQLVALAGLVAVRAWLAIVALVGGELLGVVSVAVLALVVNRWALARAPKVSPLTREQLLRRAAPPAS